MAESDEATVERCPNCGAPLQLDSTGQCVFCLAPVHVAAPQVSWAEARTGYRSPYNALDTKPPGTSDNDLVPPADTVLVFLELLGFDEVVMKQLATWGMLPQVQSLTEAVREAGKRTTLVAMQQEGYRNSRDYRELYTPAEWWEVRLGLELVAALARLPGVNPNKSASSLKGVRSAIFPPGGPSFEDAEPGSGSDQFQALRSLVPPIDVRDLMEEPAAEGQNLQTAGEEQAEATPTKERGGILGRWKRHAGT